MHRSEKSQIFVLLAPGFEESEVSTIVRTLRRSGLPVAVVGLTAGAVRGAYGMSLAPDNALSEVETELPQAIVLPGGVQGTRQLNADPRVHAFLRRVVDQGGYVMALDMAYMILHSARVLSGSGGKIAEGSDFRWRGETPSAERVVVEGQMIFGRDSGTAQESALALAAMLESKGME